MTSPNMWCSSDPLLESRKPLDRELRRMAPPNPLLTASFLYRVFSYLGLRSLAISELVCRQWRESSAPAWQRLKRLWLAKSSLILRSNDLKDDSAKEDSPKLLLRRVWVAYKEPQLSGAATFFQPRLLCDPEFDRWPETLPLRALLVGPPQIGKTSFLMTSFANIFPRNGIAPPTHDIFSPELNFRHHPVSLHITDAGHGRDLDVHLLNETDLLLISYAIDSPSSFEWLKTYWLSAIQSHLCVPVLLLGLRSDLRLNLNLPSKAFVSTKTGLEAAESFHCAGFVECSALRRYGLDKVTPLLLEIAVERLLLRTLGPSKDTYSYSATSCTFL